MKTLVTRLLLPASLLVATVAYAQTGADAPTSPSAVSGSTQPAAPPSGGAPLAKAVGVLLLMAAILVGTLWFLRSRVAIVGEFVAFLIERKLWWITPIVLFLLLMGIVVWLTEGSAIAAGVIYTFF